jgi:hypothetical protein
MTCRAFTKESNGNGGGNIHHCPFLYSFTKTLINLSIKSGRSGRGIITSSNSLKYKIHISIWTEEINFFFQLPTPISNPPSTINYSILQKKRRRLERLHLTSQQKLHGPIHPKPIPHIRNLQSPLRLLVRKTHLYNPKNSLFSTVNAGILIAHGALEGVLIPGGWTA